MKWSGPMSRRRKVIDWVLLPLEIWYEIWLMPDEYYRGKEKDFICTITYVACKVIWIFVTVLWVWLWVCPFFGF